eukprot:256096-Chlamydomonas_euryale.AAC.4
MDCSCRLASPLTAEAHGLQSRIGQTVDRRSPWTAVACWPARPQKPMYSSRPLASPATCPSCWPPEGWLLCLPCLTCHHLPHQLAKGWRFVAMADLPRRLPCRPANGGALCCYTWPVCCRTGLLKHDPFITTPNTPGVAMAVWATIAAYGLADDKVWAVKWRRGPRLLRTAWPA